MRSGEAKKLRQLVNRQLRTDAEDVINILAKQPWVIRWHYALKIIFKVRSKVTLDVIKNAER